MDSRDRPVVYKPGLSVLYVNAKVPSELKFLINYYKSVAGLPSFNWAIRQLLETHPALARLAAELVQSGKDGDGLDTPISNGEFSGSRPADVASLFLGFIRCR
jgi:hypothetical protein